MPSSMASPHSSGAANKCGRVFTDSRRLYMATTAEPLAIPLAALSARCGRPLVADSPTLAPEDTVVQSMPDVSPTKWHLAHVDLVFRNGSCCRRRRLTTVVLRRRSSTFCSIPITTRPGQMHAAAAARLLSRPTGCQRVLDYRTHVDTSNTASAADCGRRRTMQLLKVPGR